MFYNEYGSPGGGGFGVSAWRCTGVSTRGICAAQALVNHTANEALVLDRDVCLPLWEAFSRAAVSTLRSHASQDDGWWTWTGANAAPVLPLTCLDTAAQKKRARPGPRAYGVVRLSRSELSFWVPAGQLCERIGGGYTGGTAALSAGSELSVWRALRPGSLYHRQIRCVYHPVTLSEREACRIRCWSVARSKDHRRGYGYVYLPLPH